MKTVRVSDQPHGKLSERLAWASAATLAAAALTLGFVFLHRENPLPAPVHFIVDAPGNGSLPLFGRPTVSPDGQSVLYAVADPARSNVFWYLYSLASKTGRAFPEADDTTAIYWSFDSHSILLRRDGAFWRMDLKSSSRQRLLALGAYAYWQPEGTVAGGRSGLRWFRADGSGLRWIKKRDETEGKAYSYPRLIPGGRWLIYNATEANNFSVHFAFLDGNVDREILQSEHPAIYARPGYPLFRRDDTLTAQAVDHGRGKSRGGPTPIAGLIETSRRPVDLLGSFSASDNGVLVFRSDVREAPNGFTVIVNWPSLLKKK